MSFRNHSNAPTGGAQPFTLFDHPIELTLGDLSEGKTDHIFKVDAAKKALLAMPVSYIIGLTSILFGNSTPEQTTQTYQQLAKFAKTYEVGIGFHNQSKQVVVAFTDGGKVYTQTDDGVWKQVYPISTGSSDDFNDDLARVSAYAESGPAMIDDADTDVTNSVKTLIGVLDAESANVPKKKSDKLYASTFPFHVIHPGKDKQPTKTKYSHVVVQSLSERILDGSYLLLAKRW